jgi:hypothetical protein
MAKEARSESFRFPSARTARGSRRPGPSGTGSGRTSFRSARGSRSPAVRPGLGGAFAENVLRKRISGCDALQLVFMALSLSERARFPHTPLCQCLDRQYWKRSRQSRLQPRPRARRPSRQPHLELSWCYLPSSRRFSTPAPSPRLLPFHLPTLFPMSLQPFNPPIRPCS